MGIGETVDFFGEIGEAVKITHIANQEVINLTTLLSADLTIELRLVLRSTNKTFSKTKNQRASNVVRFTATDDTTQEISDLCPLNY